MLAAVYKKQFSETPGDAAPDARDSNEAAPERALPRTRTDESKRDPEGAERCTNAAVLVLAVRRVIPTGV